VAIIDWYSRYILSWKLSISLESEFCVSALEEAIKKYGKPEILDLFGNKKMQIQRYKN
jgi:putative transposase